MTPRRILFTTLAAAMVVASLAGCVPTSTNAGPTDSGSPSGTGVAAEPSTTPTPPAPTPTPTPTPTVPAVRPSLGDLIVSPDGLGDLVMGQRVPVTPPSLAIVTFTSGLSCPSTDKVAGWKVNYSHRPFAIVTKPQSVNGTVDIIETDSPAITTAQGIHFGSSRADVEAAYGKAALVSTSPITDLYVVTGTHGKLVIEVARSAYFGTPKKPYWTTDEVNTVQLMTVWSASRTPRSLVATDGIGGCA